MWTPQGRKDATIKKQDLHRKRVEEKEEERTDFIYAVMAPMKSRKYANI